MNDNDLLRMAVETAWSVFRATHEGVDEADSRRCLLERHLGGRREACESDVEDLANFGLTFLARLPKYEC